MNKRRSFIVGIKSTKLSVKEKSFLKKYKPWGVILFTRNIKNIDQTLKLTTSIRKLFKDKKLLKLLIFGSLPLIIVGFFVFKTGLINYFRSIEMIAWTTVIFAIFLYIADKFSVRKKIDTDLNLRAILAIGIFQVLALIPGVSRAGIVITAGRLLNFDRYDSAKISFFLSVPAIAGASFLNLKELTFSNIEVNFIVLLAVICSFIFSYITIKYFLIFVKKFSMNFFVIYRVCLGLVLFWFIYT